MRLFVAADLPQPMLEALAETSASLRDALRGRFVAPSTFHVTLAFLGSVRAGLVPALQEELDGLAACQGGVEATLGAFGTFGRMHKAVLWQAVDDDGGLRLLAGALRSGLRALGIAYDARQFLAHVTLMRSVDLRGGFLPVPQIASGRIEAVSLFRSDLSGPQPVYERLYQVRLARPPV